MLKQNKQQVIETRDRRIAKSIVVAYSCEISKVDNQKENYRVQSSSDPDKYYTVKFIDGTPVYCDCSDWKYRSKSIHVCIHMRGVIFAENHGLISKSYKGDEYSF
jgi:hypothetical protein